jgi:hypothetical protein
LLQAGGSTGAYREGYAGYGTLLRALGQSEHQSCLLLTSREEPLELAELSGDAAVRTLELGGLTATDARALLNDKQLQGSAADWTSLVVRYGGNGLALKVVGESVQQVFGADIAAFLQEAGSGTFGGIRRLLDGQLDRLSSLERQVLAWLGVELWDTASGRLLADLRGHTAGVRGVSLNDDGRLVATGSYDGTIKLWEAGGQLLATLQGHGGGVWGLALSAVGDMLASGGVDGTVRVWNPSDGALQRTLRGDRRYERLDITGLTGVTEANARQC